MLLADVASQQYCVVKYVGGHELAERYDTDDFDFANNYFNSLNKE
jgi:hypothetical protein